MEEKLKQACPSSTSFSSSGSGIAKQRTNKPKITEKAAFLPESDNEDELPPGWEERATLSGQVYYANHDLDSTQWTHPRTGSRKKVSENLPFGCECQKVEDNKIMYVDHHNKKTTYTDSRLAFAKEEKQPGASFRQRFDASSNALQILRGKDLTGKVAVVTGASSGIGLEVARALSHHGCLVVMASRNQAKAEKAIQRIQAERSQAKCEYMPLDLSSLASVKQFVMKLRIKVSSLDFLVLNAGVFGQPYNLTDDGFEATMQVNYLSHFYLTLLLHKTLCASFRSRVVVLSSESHRFSEIKTASEISTAQLEPMASNFSPILQYNDSKLFCLLFAQTLSRKFGHLGLRCNAVHPGNLINTGLPSSWWIYRLIFFLVRPFVKSASQGAASVVFSLASDEMEATERFTYINNCFPTPPATEDVEMGEVLWDLSMECLGRRLNDTKWMEK